MTEILEQNKEQESGKQEALDSRSKEFHERLREDRERKNEATAERSVDNARKELESLQAEKQTEKVAERTLAEKRKDTLLKAPHTSRDKSFKKTMQTVQNDLSAPSRAFSKLIHNKAVEKTSEAVGNTVARPNALLSGAVAALIFTTALYVWARYAGYPLSGFETIAAFIIGYLVGIILDFFKIMVTGKK